jgi:hypothetical protein
VSARLDARDRFFRKFAHAHYAVEHTLFLRSSDKFSTLRSQPAILFVELDGVGAKVIDYQCKRLEKEGSSNELVRL